MWQLEIIQLGLILLGKFFDLIIIIKKHFQMNLPINPFWYYPTLYVDFRQYHHQLSSQYGLTTQKSSDFCERTMMPQIKSVQVRDVTPNIVIQHQEKSKKVEKRSSSHKKPKKRGNKKKNDENFGWRKQNKDRNLISDILKQYIELVLHHPKMKELASRVIEKFKFSTDVSSFRRFVKEKFPEQKTYVGLHYTKNIIKSKQENDEDVEIFKIALKHFLVEYYPVMVLSNPEIIMEEKNIHLEKAKSLRRLICKE